MAHRQDSKQRRSSQVRRIERVIKAYNTGSFEEASAAAVSLGEVDPVFLRQTCALLARNGRLHGPAPVVTEMSFLNRVKARINARRQTPKQQVLQAKTKTTSGKPAPRGESEAARRFRAAR